MAFRQLANLDCDGATALGGKGKNGKSNPTSIEGYFIGTRTVKSPKAKSGYANLHVFQTEEGNQGVWGKTNLDQQLLGVTPGTMTRVQFTGMKETKNNPMYMYDVAVDEENTIEVTEASLTAQNGDEADDEGEEVEEESDLDEDEKPADEQPVKRASPPKSATPPPSAARQSKTRELLRGNGKSRAA